MRILLITACFSLIAASFPGPASAFDGGYWPAYRPNAAYWPKYRVDHWSYRGDCVRWWNWQELSYYYACSDSERYVQSKRIVRSRD
jgi:hypothetical protein